ncbi:hypothetical protein [Candidatus Poriferisodalis sp.]|uniref:hypothetical protein n=1 Tax=Candidatus Poriferisodalis sp. TaxID=3101277 RepID=UPI003B012555
MGSTQNSMSLAAVCASVPVSVAMRAIYLWRVTRICEQQAQQHGAGIPRRLRNYRLRNYMDVPSGCR